MGAVCHHCKKEIVFEVGERVLRSEECSHCTSDIHCCLMCEHYELNAYNDCRESNAERILEKDKKNFCSYFVLGGGDSTKVSGKDELLGAANSLFKD